MKINKYYSFAFVYFFVNTVGLPLGMLYTILLTPLFYVWLVLKGKKEILLKFFVFFAPFIVVHLINGLDLFTFVKSTLLFLTVYIFCYAFYTLISSYHEMEGIFRKLLISNFTLTIIALLFLFTPYSHLFWSYLTISGGGVSIEHWPRLAMFAYEPSYYSTLLVPVFAFYFIKFILNRSQRNARRSLMMITLSLVLSLSMGVISGLLISISILVFINASRFLTNKKLLYSISAIAISVLLALIVLIVFYPENPFFVRISAIMGGGDPSANGRTYEAFYLAIKIAHLKSVWWGIGPGQLKIIGDSVIKGFYGYDADWGKVTIPSAFAETIATFGIVGACIRFLVEVYLFFKTRVLTSYYRTLLFFFIFVYQFTGSFNTNIAEYVIWILAFTNIFPQFDKRIANSTSGYSSGDRVSQEVT
jgi:hypothetical protein